MNPGIPLILNFDLKVPLPLDQRLSVNVTGELNSIVQPYSGMAVYSADTQGIYYLKNITNGTKTWVDFPTAAQLVKNYGDETINGIKAFISRPTVNGTGVLVQGDINMGDVIGIPNFQTNAVYNDNILMNSNSSGYLTGDGYSGNYDGGYFFGRTKINSNRSKIVETSMGDNFTQIPSLVGAWRWVSCSSDGQYVTASRDNNYLYASNDFGKTWYATAKNLGTRSWRGTAISADGKYQTAVATNVVSNTAGISVSKDYGLTWVDKFIDSKDWVVPAMSSDGKYQTVVYSNGGNYEVIILRSTDYGESFSQVGPIANSVTTPNLRFVAMSSDGKYQTAVASKYILTSSNYGATWRQAYVDTGTPFFAASVTTDGRFQIVISTGRNNANGQVYISNDYGFTWKLTKDFGAYAPLTSISNSDHGRLSVITMKNGFVFTSSDYGNNWKLRTPKENDTTTLTAEVPTTTETSITVASIDKMSVTDTDGTSFLQINNEIMRITAINGLTLTVSRGLIGTTPATHPNGATVILSKDWRRAAMSNDGKFLIACDNNYGTNNRVGYIYISVSEEKVDGNFYADNLVYTAGNQNISGVKNFISRPQFNGSNLATTADVAGGAITDYVKLTTDQTIAGVKTFSSAPIFSAGASFNGAKIANAIPETVSLIASTLTLDTTHNGKIILANLATAITITVPSTLTAGFNVSIIQQGGGQVTISAGSGATLNSYGNLYKTAGQYAAISILGLGGSNFIMYGNTA